MAPLPASDAAIDHAVSEFTLHSTPDQSLPLSELRGHPGLLVFYPAEFSPM